MTLYPDAPDDFHEIRYQRVSLRFQDLSPYKFFLGELSGKLYEKDSEKWQEEALRHGYRQISYSKSSWTREEFEVWYESKKTRKLKSKHQFNRYWMMLAIEHNLLIKEMKISELKKILPK